MGLSGEYREVDPPVRIVHIEVFDDNWTDSEAVVTTEFAEHAGVTTVTQTIRYATRQARDLVLTSGMAQGMEACFQRLDALLRLW